MTQFSPTQPIGIFDSGIGGLTVANALVDLLPNENIIYFGDTAHLPYGGKSASALQAYSVKIAHLLVQQKCKLILIACHSASAAAFELVREYVASQGVVFNVIDPVVQLLRDNYANKRVGLIGTRQTVHSNVYKKKIDSLDCGIELISHPTNLLASAIEEFGDNKVIDSLLEEYLTHPSLKKLDAFVLACTHYPIVKNKIARFLEKETHIIDSAEIVAKTVKQYLEQQKLLNPQQGKCSKHFYVSDYTETFAAHAKLFFGKEITLEHYPLWE